jgi:hypothetical protein
MIEINMICRQINKISGEINQVWREINQSYQGEEPIKYENGWTQPTG